MNDNSICFSGIVIVIVIVESIVVIVIVIVKYMKIMNESKIDSAQ